MFNRKENLDPIELRETIPHGYICLLGSMIVTPLKVWQSLSPLFITYYKA